MAKFNNRIRIFKSEEQKNNVLNLIYREYVEENKTIKQISEDCGFSHRQVRYIINNYLLVKKGRGVRMKKEELNKINNDNIVEYLDDGSVILNGKLARKATVDDLMAKLKKYQKDTNKKVENK